MIEAVRSVVRRHWPRLRLRTILLFTFIFIAALPGVGALFLRVYENTLVRQTEAELIAQGAALAAAAAADWPAERQSVSAGFEPEPPAIDLRATPILPERPEATAVSDPVEPAATAMAGALQPVLRATARTTLASIILLDRHGRILIGPDAGLGYRNLPEVTAALSGHPATVLRRNGDYRAHYNFEWLSRASDLRIHHARPIVVEGKVVGALLLSRSPRALFRGIYQDRGKIVFGVVIIFATVVVLSGLLSRGIVRPIRVLGEATREVARGGGSVPEPPATAAIEVQALYVDFAMMAEAIEQRSRYLRDFAHAVSHEFKTPLAGIKGVVELLEDHHGAMSETDRRRFLANAAADTDRLTHLVSRLLELARADMAEPQAGVRTDLSSILKRLADAYDGPAFHVFLDLEPGLPAIAVPEGVVETAVGGLIENSRQAQASRISLQARSEHNVVLSVYDDGPGIPPADRHRIFEPFFTSRRAAGGTGLGLPIARSLLQSHGASIDLASSAAGALFVLHLPVVADEESSTAG